MTSTKRASTFMSLISPTQYRPSACSTSQMKSSTSPWRLEWRTSCGMMLASINLDLLKVMCSLLLHPTALSWWISICWQKSNKIRMVVLDIFQLNKNRSQVWLSITLMSKYFNHYMITLRLIRRMFRRRDRSNRV